jgi:hypothetical protein
MVKKVIVRQTGHVGVGDTIFAVQTEAGVLLTPYDPTTERAMEASDRIAKKYRAALRELSRK